MNKHFGTTFDDYLREEGVYEEVHAQALKRVIGRLLEEGMSREGISKPEMARRMRTSRSQLDRVLDPKYVTIQLDTLMKAATAIGQEVVLLLKPLPARARS